MSIKRLAITLIGLTIFWMCSLPVFSAGPATMQPVFSDWKLYEDDAHSFTMAYAKSDVKSEVQQMKKFKTFLDKQGVKLLYVNAPVKYLNDDAFEATFGVPTYVNQNADLFLQRIGKIGISSIDLRKCMVAEGLAPETLFYRTEHHWNNQAALFAARNVAATLNSAYGYQIDLNLYNPANFKATDFKACWLGEYGKKTAVMPPLDDYTLLLPNYPTAYSFPMNETTVDGTFEDFIDRSYLTSCGNVYQDRSCHYAYRLRSCINKNVSAGRVLLLCDSFSQNFEPFLSLGVHSIDWLIIRDAVNTPGFSLQNIIKTGNYDTVIICYSAAIIGAKDDPAQAANATMFQFL